MNHERPEDLTPDERSAIESMSQPVVPPTACEDRIVQSLRERDLIRDCESGLRGSGTSREPEMATGGMAVSFPRNLFRRIPRVALTAAALVGAFFLGAEYGKVATVPGPSAVQRNKVPEMPEVEGKVFKNADGEMVAAVTFEDAHGVRPDPMLAFAAPRKPPMKGDADEVIFAVAPLDGSETSFSLRYP